MQKSLQYLQCKNGVQQGAVNSGILYAIYFDELLELLRESGLGCRIYGVFYGALIFADDIILLSASRNGLQIMVDMCQNFVASRNLKFGTNADPTKSKTKCILFTRRNIPMQEVRPIKLDGNDLPWVDSLKHLGHILEKDNSMRLDITQKRGMFIGKANSLLQEFNNVSREVFLKVLNNFATNIYASNLWNIFGKHYDKLFKSYNVAIRNALKVDRCTHRYLLEPLSKELHLKTMLCSHFVAFHNSLLSCPKFPVRFLARLSEGDLRTVHGRNIYEIGQLCNSELELLKPKLVKKNVKYSEILRGEAWRIGLCNELLLIRDDEECYVPGFDSDELDCLLRYLCVT